MFFSSLLSEDEQRNGASSQKALHAVTMEKEAALADLNSVERSLSDVFRRYENMKSTLEGFKKVRGHRTSSRLDKHFWKVSIFFMLRCSANSSTIGRAVSRLRSE